MLAARMASSTARDCELVRYRTAIVASTSSCIAWRATRTMNSDSSSSSAARKNVILAPPFRSVQRIFSRRLRLLAMTAEAASRMTCVER